MRGILIATTLGCVALIGMAIFFTVNNRGGGPRTVALSETYNQRVSDGYWKRGTATPKVTVLEYLDFHCATCAQVATIVDETYQQTKDIAQFQVRLYPLFNLHNKARVTARAAEAAGRQGKFWDMYTLLFTHETSWDGADPETMRDTISQYADALNLNIGQFNTDMQDGSLDEPVDRDIAAGNRIPLQDTPTFLINGTVVAGIPATSEEFVTLIKNTAAQAQ